jgi:hypothetical protein
VKVSGALMNMILVIISALVTNVVAYAQLSTELEPAHSVTSQQLFHANAKATAPKYLSALVQSKQKQAYHSADFGLPVYTETQKYRIDQQSKLTVEFKAVQHVFMSINDKTIILTPLLNSTPSEIPS